MVRKIDNSTLQSFFMACDARIAGKFVILGGSVMHLINYSDRVTLDIDVAAFNLENLNLLQAQLIGIADAIGLPFEAINQAASFFLYKVPDWNENLVMVFGGENCSFYRPNAFLYIQLKAARLSENDLEDCLRMIRFARKKQENIDLESLEKVLTGFQKDKKNSDFQERMDRLKGALKRV